MWEGGKLWSEQNPIRFAASSIRLFFYCRRAGLPSSSQSDARELVRASALKVPSKLIVFPEENHWISKGEDSRFWYSEFKAGSQNICSRRAGLIRSSGAQ